MASMYFDLFGGAQLNEGAITAAFGLSKREFAVAHFIASGLSPKEVAQKTGRSPETVRSQLKQLFQKTDTHRQSELVALLLRVN
jgi:DNA-binding CsgD family transcriptional regulator